MKILVVDDSLTVRMDLAEALEAAGLTAIPVGSLAQARAALDGSIACVVLDVILPDGSGITLLEEIRNRATTANLPVLLLSTEGEVKDRIRGLKTGANDYIGKPYDTAFLIARIREVAGNRTAPSRAVLLIDDSATFRMMLSEALTEAGFATLQAASGTEGLRMAAAHVPAAIIVDGVMPDMDGSAVIRKIRLDPTLRTTPCVLLTGSEGSEAELRALDAGADAFVRKEADLDMILARVSAVLRAASSEPARASSGPRRVLAVDDSATYLGELGDVLRAEGYDVVLASSGEEALELIAVQHVDCILMDRIMPGLSGAETCARIKSAPVVRDIPLIMLTALDGREAMIDGLAQGADDFISKGAGFDVLKARIQAQLRRKQFEDEHRRTREQLLRTEHQVEEARTARELAETRAAMAEQLQRANRELESANRELESFSYSVSHDLRAPLRAISGFVSVIAEDYGTAFDATGTKHIERILSATKRMDAMISDMLRLARVASGEILRKRVDVSAIASAIGSDLVARHPERTVELVIAPDVMAEADAGMLRTALENLMENAWKFTRNRPDARIEFGTSDGAYFIRDNGAGFSMTSADKLFRPFQRLHTAAEFEGTGIGLATVQRVIARHGGRIWAEGVKGEGATFYFTV